LLGFFNQQAQEDIFGRFPYIIAPGAFHNCHPYTPLSWVRQWARKKFLKSRIPNHSISIRNLPGIVIRYQLVNTFNHRWLAGT